VAGNNKKRKIQLLSDHLGTVLSTQQWGRQIYLFTLTRHWPEIAGQERAEYCMPAYFRRDVLWIYVDSSIWMQQLQMAKPELLTRINRFLKEKQHVEDLRWLVQPAGLIDPPEEEYIPPPLTVDPAAEKNLHAMAKSIPDPTTRKAFCTMWRHLNGKQDKKS
jgi:hypothetical protein